MRLSRLVTLLIGVAAVAGCGNNDKITEPKLPPLAGVRFINALSDTGAVDIRAIDQVEWSPVANQLAYRAGTQHQPTEAGVRRFRVFPNSTNAAIASQILYDGQVTIVADTRVTLLVTGSARAGTVQLWMIEDAPGAPPAGQISVRMVNAAGGIVNGYLVASTSSALPATETFSNIGGLVGSPYVSRGAGVAALQVTNPGSTAVNAALAGPAATAALPGAFPAAGVTQEGTSFSVYYFAPGAAGSPNAAVTAPSLVWFIDRNPCDDPPVAGCGQ